MAELLFLVGAAALVLAITFKLAQRWRARNKKACQEQLLMDALTGLLNREPSASVEPLRQLYSLKHEPIYGLALGSVCRTAEKKDVALRTHLSLDARLDLDPQVQAVIHSELAADYAALGDFPTARTYLEKALKTASLSHALVISGQQIYAALGDFPAAIQLIKRYAKNSNGTQNEPIVHLCNHLAEQALASQAWSAAKTALRLANAAVKNHPQTLLSYAKLLIHSGKPRVARNYLKKRLDAFGDHAWQALQLYLLAAQSDNKESRFARILETYLAKHPQDWRTRALRVHYFIEIGQFETAADEIMECLVAAPHNMKLHQDVWTLLARGGDPRLLGRYRTHLKKFPERMKLYFCPSCDNETNDFTWTCPRCLVAPLNEREL